MTKIVKQTTSYDAEKYYLKTRINICIESCRAIKNDCTALKDKFNQLYNYVPETSLSGIPHVRMTSCDRDVFIHFIDSAIKVMNESIKHHEDNLKED